MTISQSDIQRQLNFKRQSRRLVYHTKKTQEQQLLHIEEDIKLQKQLIKKGINEKNIINIQKYAQKLIASLAKKTSIYLYELHQEYKFPPQMIIKQLVQQYTKEALKVKIIMDNMSQRYGDTKS